MPEQRAAMKTAIDTAKLAVFMATTLLLGGLILPAGAAAPPKRVSNDFPTQARVEFVLGCIKDHADFAQQEMLYKCTCAIDEIAARVNYDDWTVLATFANATSIAGERGTAIRDRKDTRSRVTQYRELVAQANKACFIAPKKS